MFAGVEAANLFYKIRQKYGKERRKIMESRQGRSGQCAQDIYESLWPLYELCDTFLGVAVIPRKYVDYLFQL